MISRIAPNIILSIVWLLVSESRIIIGTFFLVSIIFLILMDKSKFAQKLLYFLGILAFIPILDSNNIFSQIILLVVINTYIYFYSKSEQVSFNIGVYVVTAISYIVFNYLYSFAGKILSLISYLGFDNTGHLGLLFAITKKGDYLNPFTESGTDLGLTFWKYYPQGVVGSISTLLRTLGLDVSDNNKFSFILFYAGFSLFLYVTLFYIIYHFLLDFNSRKGQSFAILIIIIISTLSFTSIFLIYGFINYNYGLLIILLYILYFQIERSFFDKLLIFILILTCCPFLSPVLVANEAWRIYIRYLKTENRIKGNEILTLLSLVAVFIFYALMFLKNWGYSYLSAVGYIPELTVKIYLVNIFTFFYITLKRFRSKTNLNQFERIILINQILFILLAGITLNQSGDITYYATKQGYLVAILSILFMISQLSFIEHGKKILKISIIVLFLFLMLGPESLRNKIQFFREYGSNSPQISVDGERVAKAISIATSISYDNYIYTGLYDTDLSSRLVNGSIFKWNDVNSGLFFGLNADASLEQISKKIIELDKLAVELKLPNMNILPSDILVFYVDKSVISKTISNNKFGVGSFFIG